MGIAYYDVGLLTSYVAQQVLQMKDRVNEVVEISLDLGLSKQRCTVLKEGLLVKDDVIISWDCLEEIAGDDRGVYTAEAEPKKLCFFSGGHFYMLVATAWGHAPTVEIDGIHMHRVKDAFPEQDALKKVKLLGRISCKKVLDLCTGLGYTAIWEKRLGACKVITVEKDRNVLELARYNPWSRELFAYGIEIVEKDAVEYVKQVDMEFDAILHDPPTIKLAGELYSLDLYKNLYRILRKNGVLVHYVGSPGARGGVRIYAGVMKRMRKAGFMVSFDRSTECVKAVKV